MARVKIESPPGLTSLGTRVYIDGNEIHHVRCIDFRIAVGEVPTAEIELSAAPDIDTECMTTFDYSVRTVNDAARVLRNELSKHDSLYSAWIASIRSAIEDCKSSKDLAKHILERLIGE